jgi:hypothetical protein
VEVEAGQAGKKSLGLSESFGLSEQWTQLRQGSSKGFRPLRPERTFTENGSAL